MAKGSDYFLSLDDKSNDDNSPSRCATKGSAERSSYIFLVVRPAHNLLIALPASPPTILFQFEQTIAFQPVHFFIYIYIF